MGFEDDEFKSLWSYVDLVLIFEVMDNSDVTGLN